MTPTEDQFAGDTISYTFPKEERLCSKKLIGQLFSKGSSFNLYPLRFQFITLPESETPAVYPQVLVSVSKRSFKRAHDRNRLKRQIKEAYRLHKHLLFKNPEVPPFHLLAIIYIGKEKKPFSLIEKKLISGLERCLIR